MIILDNTLISEEILKQKFVCDLSRCKGACCEEGDFGAPLEEEELDLIESNLDTIRTYMTPKGIQVLEEKGFYELDIDNELATTTIDGRDCLFAKRNPQGLLKCSIEEAYEAQKINFRKPISCHLYPIRITKSTYYDALNYNEWSICAPACELGKILQVPVYFFLKTPLIRKFGQEWFDQLHEYAQQHLKPQINFLNICFVLFS